jgi:hypothetical protein
MVTLCSFKGCFGKAHSKGLCGSHYAQQRVGKELVPLQKQFHGLSEKDRFFKRVGKLDSGCWLWLGSLNTGYGQFRRDDGSIVLAHRFSYVLHNETAVDGLVVMHKCDTPRCVNPEHLILGTQAENVQDMRQKGREKHRSLSGSDHGMSKLTEMQVKEIRDSKETGPAIAQRIGISTTTVYDVRNRRIWKHVE